MAYIDPPLLHLHIYLIRSPVQGHAECHKDPPYSSVAQRQVIVWTCPLCGDTSQAITIYKRGLFKSCTEGHDKTQKAYYSTFYTNKTCQAEYIFGCQFWIDRFKSRLIE